MARLKLALAIVLAVLGVLLLWFLGHVGWILYDGFTDEPYTAHVAVVFGNQIQENGEPSERLKARLDKAFELYADRRVQRVLVSGGLGVEGFQEAIEMGRYLVKRGVPKEMILVDPLGDTTYLTASNSKQMLFQTDNLRSVVVVSSYYHILRAKMAMMNCGFTAVYGAHSEYFEWRDLYWSLPREVLGFYSYLFKNCPPPVRF